MGKLLICDILGIFLTKDIYILETNPNECNYK